MSSLDITNRLTDLLARYASRVKIKSSLNYTDENREAQNVLIPLFRVIFKLPDLTNLDLSVHQNYPGIDLADNTARVAFQITSNGTGPKVRDTLEKFSLYNLDQKYDRLVIYNLEEKQKAYGIDFSNIVSHPFKFDEGADILDYTDLLPLIKALSQDEQQQVLDLLEYELDGTLFEYAISQEQLEKHKLVYVPPVQFKEALDTLRQHGIVILAGPPHVGKTETGIELLLNLSADRYFGNVLRLEQVSDWSKLQRVQQRALLMDDLFGASEFDNKLFADRFDTILRMARENLIVITSRQEVLDKALTHGRMNERNYNNYIVKLVQEGSYTDENLKQILEKQVIYHTSTRVPEQTLLTDAQATMLNSSWQLIVQELRFPHNIARLIEEAATESQQLPSLSDLVEAAKDIKRAATHWYSRQEEPIRILVAIAALFPNNTIADIQQFYTDVCSMRNITSVEIKRVVRQSAGYMRLDTHIALAHPSYTEGIIDALRDEDLDLAWSIVRLRASRVAHQHLSMLIQCHYAVRLLGQDEWGRQNVPLPISITIEEYFSDFIETYNYIIEQNFPQLRKALQPNWDGKARVHVHKMETGEAANWILLQQRGDKPDVSVSLWPEQQVTPILSAAEVEASRTTDQNIFVRSSAPDTRIFIPQIEALYQVCRQVPSSFSAQASLVDVFLAESWHLRMARLLLMLESAGFPLEAVNINQPLTAQQLEEWAGAFFDNDNEPMLPLGTVQMRRVIYPDIKKINDLVVQVAAEDIKILDAENHPVTGEFLTRPDLSWSNLPYYPGGTATSDLYTDERLREAITHGLRMQYEAYKSTVERSFPTLYSQLDTYSKLPLSFTCVVDRTSPYAWSRPSIRYDISPRRDNNINEPVQILVYMISENVSSQEREQAMDIQQNRWREMSGDWIVRGTVSVNNVLNLKNWYTDVIEDIIKDFRDLVKQEL